MCIRDRPGTDWDAPLQGGLLPPIPPPGPEVFDLRRRPPTASGSANRLAFSLPLSPSVYPFSNPADQPDGSETASGSNNWAVSGRLTARGGAEQRDQFARRGPAQQIHL